MPADEQESGVRVNGACCHDNGSDAGNELTAPEGEDSEPEASGHLPGDKGLCDKFTKRYLVCCYCFSVAVCSIKIQNSEAVQKTVSEARAYILLRRRGHATPHMPVETAKCWWLLKIEPNA